MIVYFDVKRGKERHSTMTYSDQPYLDVRRPSGRQATLGAPIRDIYYRIKSCLDKRANSNPTNYYIDKNMQYACKQKRIMSYLLKLITVVLNILPFLRTLKKIAVRMKKIKMCKITGYMIYYSCKYLKIKLALSKSNDEQVHTSSCSIIAASASSAAVNFIATFSSRHFSNRAVKEEK